MMTIRKATPSDVPALLGLINDYAARGIMLPRTEFELCENLRDFVVAIETTGSNGSREEHLAGCGALHLYTMQTAEVRSLAVSERRKATGVGKKIVAALLDEAREYKLDLVFAFTYVKPFFEKCGFAEVDRGTLPLKAWKDCIRCPKFSCCDETAMVCLLSPDAMAHAQEAAPSLIQLTPLNPMWTLSPEEQIQMPTPAPGRGFQQR